MPTENHVLDFVAEVNEKLWEIYKMDYPMLDYWSNGCVEGIKLGDHHLWDNDNDETLDKKLILERIDDVIANWQKLHHIISTTEYKGE